MLPPTASPELASRREAALRFLYDRINYERAISVPYRAREFKLERMVELLARLGNPQQGLRVVHIAGTKGKGSTSAMIGSILKAAGLRTGVFTSPHLERIEERLAIDGQPCSEEDFVRLVDRLLPIVQLMDAEAARCTPTEDGPTYFDITTAMALCYFAERRVDVAVLEGGLGGRLDSTNVCQPQVAVITSISFDHMKQLGNTLESIAWEKAGIIKPGVPVVSGVTTSGAQEVIRHVCQQRVCRLIELGSDFGYHYRAPRGLERAPGLGSLDFFYTRPSSGRSYQGLPLRLIGEHQAANAAVALATLDVLCQSGWEIAEAAVRSGLAEVRWPARIELVARQPAVVVDAAHNLASVDALVRALEESFFADRKHLIFATTQEKDLRGMLARLDGVFDRVIFTRYLNNPRSVPPEELLGLWRELTDSEAELCATPAEAWAAVRRSAAPGDLIAVTGSFFIAAEMRNEIARRPFDQIAG